jgi:hypothetical protein
MRHYLPPLLALALALLPDAALASQVEAPAEVLIDSLASRTAERGQRVAILGAFPVAVGPIQVDLARINGRVVDSVPLRVPAARARGGEWITFEVPQEARLARYRVSVHLGTTGPTLPVTPARGLFRIVSPDPVKISSISPQVDFPDSGRYRFTISGEGFSPLAEDNVLLFQGMPDARLCAPGESPPGCLAGTVTEDGRTIVLSAVPQNDYRGALNVGVLVGDRASDARAALTLSPVSAGLPLVIALITVVLLIVMVYLLVPKVRWTGKPPRGRRFFGAALIDEETNTYSLSKLQFYLWTTAAIFGYAYLSAARSLVQGTLELADVPENLPGILLLTASTSLLAVGISSAKGSKGAGERDPSFADFITTGGVIAPERLQFLVWTIVGVIGFIALTIARGPGRIDTLPAIPERLLYLMGLSSFAYVGGKLARKPGPVINDLAVRWGSLTFEIHGMHLAVDAIFRVSHLGTDQEIRSSLLSNNGRPEAVVPDDDPGFAKVLKVTIEKVPPEWLDEQWQTAEHNFTIVNPDGQKAVATFRLREPTTLPPQAGTPMTSPAEPGAAAATPAGPGDQPAAGAGPGAQPAAGAGPGAVAAASPGPGAQPVVEAATDARPPSSSLTPGTTEGDPLTGEGDPDAPESPKSPNDGGSHAENP